MHVPITVNWVAVVLSKDTELQSWPRPRPTRWFRQRGRMQRRQLRSFPEGWFKVCQLPRTVLCVILILDWQHFVRYCHSVLNQFRAILPLCVDWISFVSLPPLYRLNQFRMLLPLCIDWISFVCYSPLLLLPLYRLNQFRVLLYVCRSNQFCALLSLWVDWINFVRYSHCLLAYSMQSVTRAARTLLSVTLILCGLNQFCRLLRLWGLTQIRPWLSNCVCWFSFVRCSQAVCWFCFVRCSQAVCADSVSYDALRLCVLILFRTMLSGCADWFCFVRCSQAVCWFCFVRCSQAVCWFCFVRCSQAVCWFCFVRCSQAVRTDSILYDALRLCGLIQCCWLLSLRRLIGFRQLLPDRVKWFGFFYSQAVLANSVSLVWINERLCWKCK